MPIRITEYVIRYDPRLKGWIAFRVAKDTEGHAIQVVERTAITNPKPLAHLAARALTRVLRGESK
jgi:hypothetical protein